MNLSTYARHLESQLRANYTGTTTARKIALRYLTLAITLQTVAEELEELEMMELRTPAPLDPRMREVLDQWGETVMKRDE